MEGTRMIHLDRRKGVNAPKIEMTDISFSCLGGIGLPAGREVKCSLEVTFSPFLKGRGRSIFHGFVRTGGVVIGGHA